MAAGTDQGIVLSTVLPGTSCKSASIPSTTTLIKSQAATNIPDDCWSLDSPFQFRSAMLQGHDGLKIGLDTTISCGVGAPGGKVTVEQSLQVSKMGFEVTTGGNAAMSGHEDAAWRLGRPRTAASIRSVAISTDEFAL